MRTLLDLFSEIRRLDHGEAIRFYNGFRTWRVSYWELYVRAAGFACDLDRRGFQKGDRLLLWGENRPEWVEVFWGCLARAVEVVPIDYRSSPQLVKRIQAEVGACLLVHGETVPGREVQMDRLSFHQVEEIPPADQLEIVDVSPTDVVEIVYTSGTTSDPKGVIHRHKNICANLRPFQREIQRYKKWARPFKPLRILDLLPLSHMFGQSLGLFIPVLLEGTVVFMSETNPGAIQEAILRHRVSVLVSIPRLLANLQRDIERNFDLPEKRSTGKGFPSVLARWWRFRQVHAALGWKFWALVVGGARVDSEIEAFWSRLGFLVLQGYGMTETGPVVAVNHPFDSCQGSIGKALDGQDVKIAPDGEILVRGESVTSEYLVAGQKTRAIAEDGWLHTGDLGEIDPEGRLYYRGRKKDVIVTPEGLNVYPQDVEVVLNQLPEINDSTVIGFSRNEQDVVHAVLILRKDGTACPELIQKANENLEPYQRIRSWSVWLEEDFPRTASTLKVKRGEVASRLAAQFSRRGSDQQAEEETEMKGLKGIVAQMTGKQPSQLEGDLRLSEDLGLSSLEQVDLLSRLESEYGVELDEEVFTRLSSITELQQWLCQVQESQQTVGPRRSVTETVIRSPLVVTKGGNQRAERVQPEYSKDWQADAAINLPRWARFPPTRLIRLMSLESFVLPLFRHYIDLSVVGVEELKKVKPPVIFAANHVSHLDTPAILASLPFAWRHRVAPAMTQEYFQAYLQAGDFPWKERLSKGFQYYLACTIFSAYPLPQKMGGVRRALKYTGELIDQGYSPLVYPEGSRSPDGRLQPFKPGIGLMALRLRIPVVPIYLDGLFKVHSIHDDWPQPGKVQVSIGSPLKFGQDNYQAVVRQIEKALQNLRICHPKLQS